MVKYVLITGGVISGLGKGVVASSTGLLLRKLGYKVTAIKIDPYLNVDAGLMSPFEHGEVFILNDGGEADLDLGNYERFMDLRLTRWNNITTGKIYGAVIERERRGYYLGKTVQVVPHITDMIKEWVVAVGKTPSDPEVNLPPIGFDQLMDRNRVTNPEEEPDICILELGGTIGDMESMPFVEALRQLSYEVGQENFVVVHVSLVPSVGMGHEQKSKPTQASVRELRSLGLHPEVLVGRSEEKLSSQIRYKLSQFCQVKQERVISLHNVSNIFWVPLLLLEQGYISHVLTALKVTVPENPQSYLESWKEMASVYDDLSATSDEDSVNIAMIGKYFGLPDTYLSIHKALIHASVALQRRVVVTYVNAEHIEEGYQNRNDPSKSQLDTDAAWAILKKANGFIVPGGFGIRGIEGKITAIKYARENNIPFLGICLGMQLAVIESARNLCGLPNATTEELQERAEVKVVIEMEDHTSMYLGGTMRLGGKKTHFKNMESKIAKLYNTPVVVERHRHRFEVNPAYVHLIEDRCSLRFVATDSSKTRMEVLEMLDHPYFVGVQYHPEMTTGPGRPNPCFLGLIQACIQQIDEKK